MPARRFTDEEEERLRLEYETDWDETEEIAERWGLTMPALYNLAGARRWRRPTVNTYTRLRDEGPFREQIKLLWDSNASCEEIARYIGVTADNARKACTRAFGDRNLYVVQQTYMVKRNRQIHRMRYMGASVEDLARAFRLSEITVHWIIRKLNGKNKKSGGFWRGRKVKPFSEVRVAYLQQYFDEDYAQHEAFLREMLLKAAKFFDVPAHLILWDKRGTRKQAQARQVVAYIMHVECGLTMQRVAELMGRDRSTVSYSARRVEDRRDDDKVDEDIQRLADDFLARIRSDMDFVSPYELYLPAKVEEPEPEKPHPMSIAARKKRKPK